MEQDKWLPSLAHMFENKCKIVCKVEKTLFNILTKLKNVDKVETMLTKLKQCFYNYKVGTSTSTSTSSVTSINH